MRLVRLFGGIVALSLQRALAYRADMIFQALMTAFGLAAGIAAVTVVYAHVHRLAGWDLPETLALLGAFTFVTGLLETFIEPNLDWFGTKLLNGQLDDTLLQPAPSLFLASCGTTQPWSLSQVGLGVIIMALGLARLGAPVLPANVLAGTILLLSGVVIVWAYRVVLASLAFWAPGLQAGVLFQGIWQMGRYPISMYRQPLRLGMTYVIPVAFVTTTPIRVMVHGTDPLLTLESVAAILGSVGIAMFVWRAGLRRYTGATT